MKKFRFNTQYSRKNSLSVILRSIKGYTASENATSVTSLYSTIAVCTSFLTSLSNSSTPAWNFSYNLPNLTSVEGNNTNSGSDSVNIQGLFSIQDACESTWEAQNITVPQGAQLQYEEMALYYWQDQDLNSSWWSHFQTDPFTSQYSDCDGWGFYPTDSNNFRCVTQNNVYQVNKSHFFINTILGADKGIVGLLIRMAIHSLNYQFLLAARSLDPLARL
jgi:hypothetical protein